LFRLLRERTLLIWLKTQPGLHMSRVLSQGDRRPMTNRPDAQAELQALLTARTPYYEQARIIVDTSKPTPAACVKKLLSALRELQ
jgi:shikimate kinase